ncbi:MAG: universal stress protein [Acidobacteria bacterium]|nr:universal stress protein [Acidobacteriota bacterium]
MKVLLATDGSKYSEAAVDLLPRLPLPDGSEVTLLAVVEPVRPLFAAEHPIIGKQISEAFEGFRTKLREGAHRLLLREEQRLRTRGLAVNTTMREGHVSDQIVAACRELPSDLLVIGSRGLGEFRGLLLGSVSQQVVKHAPCSVLIVKLRREGSERPADLLTPEKHDDAGLRVLLAYDGSPDASAALQTLKSLPLGAGVAVRVLTVVPELSRYGFDSASLRLLTEVWEEERQAAELAANQAVQEIGITATNVSAQIRDGDPAEQVLKAAGELGADVIMLGAKGKSAIERFFLGSVSTHVLHGAPCSVWIVRP